MAKSDYGLPANSKATRRTTSREEEELRLDLAYGKISRSTYYKKLRELQECGKIYRR